MRIVWHLVAIVVTLIVGWSIGMSWKNRELVGAMNQRLPPTIEQIQALSQLVTDRVNVSDVIESHLIGRTGSITAIVVVRGSLLISTDLSRAHLESIDESARRIVLVLPEPTVLQAAVDHDQTHVFAMQESGLWKITPNDSATSAAVVDLAYREAQQFVADTGNNDALLARARQYAADVLRTFVRTGQWELTVKWAG